MKRIFSAMMIVGICLCWAGDSFAQSPAAVQMSKPKKKISSTKTSSLADAKTKASAAASPIPDMEDRIERLEYLEETSPSGLKKESLSGTNVPLPSQEPAPVAPQGGLTLGPMEYLKKMQEEGAWPQESPEESVDASATNASLSQTPSTDESPQNAGEEWDFWETP